MTSMHNSPTDPLMTHGDDREVLSALFDGELEAEATRFAHRRLAHDGRWREACGRWQLAGDVLRRRAEAVAPTGFADRLARAIADEAPAAAQTAVPLGLTSHVSPRTTRRRWVPGAALAASVAVAALFVARPLSGPDAAGSDTGPAPAQQVAVEASAPTGATGPASSAVVATSTDPAGVETGDVGFETGLSAAAAAVAVAEVPRRSAERRSRGQSQRAAVRVARREPSLPVVVGAATGTSAETVASLAGSAPAASDVVADVSAAVRDPFHPGDAGANVRPWPRAVLPGSGGQGGYTVGYGEPVPVSPSFYPFEPRLSEGEVEPPVSPPGR
ncbi:RseA family anti-sigma factor [Marilutibacter chinensis]|uniref:Anti sigma-E protein RseA N-terminal domain-containing protein n=1 Tax=Marilutibacter chinensis TaxID=2912247 RepID=A0ABS9HX94_9GAMM|nr:RseA family anti-sigma factor [Lysobacter chinensis]MCF7223495.1 hypothetical protein [Lysobacter chinensis]